MHNKIKKVLILQLRPEDEAANDEFRAFLQYGKLKDEDVERVRMEKTGLPKDFKLNHYSAIIIGGGPQNISDKQEKKGAEQLKLEKTLFNLLDEIIEQDFPLLGACLGVGLLASHQGCSLSKKYGETVSAIDLTLTEEGRKDDVLKNIPETFRAYVGHKEACDALTDTCTLLASGENCPVQMFRVKQNIYATQFHPELDLQGIITRVGMYKHMGYFPPEEAEQIIKNAKKENLDYAGMILGNFVKKYQR